MGHRPSCQRQVWRLARLTRGTHRRHATSPCTAHGQRSRGGVLACRQIRRRAHGAGSSLRPHGVAELDPHRSRAQDRDRDRPRPGLRLAGLAPRPATRTPGVSRDHAIEMFLEELHRLPTYKEVKKYAQPNGVSLARETTSHPKSIDLVRRPRVADTDGAVRLSRSWHREPATRWWPAPIICCAERTQQSGRQCSPLLLSSRTVVRRHLSGRRRSPGSRLSGTAQSREASRSDNARHYRDSLDRPALAAAITAPSGDSRALWAGAAWLLCTPEGAAGWRADCAATLGGTQPAGRRGPEPHIGRVAGRRPGGALSIELGKGSVRSRSRRGVPSACLACVPCPASG